MIEIHNFEGAGGGGGREGEELTAKMQEEINLKKYSAKFTYHPRSSCGYRGRVRTLDGR